MSPDGAGVALRAERVSKHFGGLTAVDAVDLVAEPGRVTALIGPNGAGKTTLFACLTGVLRADAGRVLLGERDITRLGSDERARLGIGRTFQRLNVFTTMSVFDNLLTGAESRHPGSLWRGVLGVGEPTGRADAARAEEVLARLGLREVRAVPAGALPTGTLRLVELGRALCGDPGVLLLDEPASGLDSAETANLRRVLREVAAAGVAVLLVEHDVELVFDVADTVYAMAEGRVLVHGDPAVVSADPRVQQTYLDPAGTA